MRGLKSVVLAVGFLVTLPLAAFAQAGLAGLVRDVSGAVLPGVTVEASSPVLIEKVRTAVTDDSGRYSMADLRGGTYRVAFTLPGFKTVVRDGVEISGTSVFTVSADLAVGAVEETITVSGETPVVNLQTTTRQAVMDQEIVSAIPSSRTPFTKADCGSWASTSTNRRSLRSEKGGTTSSTSAPTWSARSHRANGLLQLRTSRGSPSPTPS